jgi:hypothetical protein
MSGLKLNNEIFKKILDTYNPESMDRDNLVTSKLLVDMRSELIELFNTYQLIDIPGINTQLQDLLNQFNNKLIELNNNILEENEYLSLDNNLTVLENNLINISDKIDIINNLFLEIETIVTDIENLFNNSYYIKEKRLKISGETEYFYPIYFNYNVFINDTLIIKNNDFYCELELQSDELPEFCIMKLNIISQDENYPIIKIPSSKLYTSTQDNNTIFDYQCPDLAGFYIRGNTEFVIESTNRELLDELELNVNLGVSNVKSFNRDDITYLAYRIHENEINNITIDSNLTGIVEEEYIQPEIILTNQITDAGISHSILIKKDKTVIGLGSNENGQINVSTWNNIKQVACGYSHSIGLKEDGTVIGTGLNTNNQLDVSSWTNIKQVACGYNHTVGLKIDGTVVATGYNNYGQCNVSGINNVKYIACGHYHTVFIHNDGTVSGIGKSDTNQLNFNDWVDVIQVSCGLDHTLGLFSNGTCKSVGKNQTSSNLHKVDTWSDIIYIASGQSHSIGVKSDGTCVGVSITNFFGEINVQDWVNVIQVSCGTLTTIGIKNDGTCYATGYNNYGQLDILALDLF